jgi:hypothetical protein
MVILRWDALRLMVILVGQQIIVGGRAGDRVFFLGPRTQIDLFAAFGTKWTELVRLGPFDFFVTGRAIDYWHG